MDTARDYERGAAADLWRRTMSQIPTVFGRLVYLASLREPNSGDYRHYGLAQRFSEAEADATLRESHAQTFAQWLTFNLEQQKSDLDEYLSSLEEQPRKVVAAWIRLATVSNLVPVSARDVERQLFASDLGALLEVLKHEHA